MGRTRPLRVLALPRYAPLGASSRLRFYQYLPYLRGAGCMEVRAEPLLPDSYVQALYGSAARPGRGRVLRAYAHRLSLLRSARRQFDLVWLEKELFPYLPAWGERLLNRIGIPYVVDYDDATFHQYDSHRLPLVRQRLGGKIAEVMRRAATVAAGNAYLDDYARKSGARRVERLPTAVDLSRYAPAVGSAGFVIGWVGTPLTARYVREIQPALEQVCGTGPGIVHLVGGGALQSEEGVFRTLPWSEKTEVAEIQKFSVGIMPLPDAPFERGKCGYKLIQYMACGVPVVASPVGVNRTLVRQDENGLLAGTGDEWVAALGRLREEALRTRLGSGARRTVEQEFSTAITAPHLAALLRSAAD
ncbi:MAG: glycosyltransferase family 4 protein [Cytophagales bacterium]|nr:glycosyltransferase family 4 protein [Armatimonadota bacterium]